MSRIVMVTGAGKECALGFNLVLRYLENGDTVIATVRKESPALFMSFSLQTSSSIDSTI